MEVNIDPLQKNLPKTRWPPKTKWLPKHKIDHNSLKFQARISRFCVVVHIDHPQKKNSKTKHKKIITHSIFKLEAPDFA